MQAELQQTIEKGEQLYHRGLLEQAAVVFQSILEQSPGHADALNNLGAISFNRGNRELAESYFLQSLKSNGGCKSALSNLLQLYDTTGQHMKAQNLLRDMGADLLVGSKTPEPTSDKTVKKVQGIENYLPEQGTFRASFHELDITPSASEAIPVLLQGYAGPPRFAASALDPLKMQLMLIEDDHYTKLLIVTADLLGFSAEMIQAIRNHAAVWGIEPAGIIINASHTHNAPGTIPHLPQQMGPYCADYARKIAILIQKNLQYLYDNLEEAQLSWSATKTQIGLNRRPCMDDCNVIGPNPDGPYDRHTPFIRVELTRSTRKILLIRHSCHPTGLSGTPMLSADFPGRLRETIRSGGHADGVMFLQGAAGTSKQVKANCASKQFADTLEDVCANGDHLSKQIIARLELPMCRIQGNISAVLEHKQLTFASLPNKYQLEKLAGNFKTDPLLREWSRNLLHRFPQSEFPKTATIEIQAVRMGSELTFIIINGWPAMLASGAESVMKDFVETLPNAFAPKAARPVYGRHHEFCRHQNAFFVLSTGRCGTMTLAHILDTSTNAQVYHQPQPDPVRESLQAYRGEIGKTQTFWKFRYGVMHQAWSRGRIYGETDHLMTQFSEEIARELPEAKFIGLVRDPRNFVRSGMRRKYYRGHLWDIGRLRPREGTSYFEQWNQFDPFEKVCWLWNDTYQRIRDIARRLGPNRMQFLRLEDLIADPAVASELFDFLDLEGYDPDAIKSVMTQKLNAQKQGDFPSPQDWTQAQHDCLWRMCGALAEQFGYKRDYDLHLKKKKWNAADKTAKTGSDADKRPIPQTGHGVKDHKGQIAEDSVITCPFTIGDYSNIMGKAIIKGNRACRIGKYCAMGWGIHIITSHHDMSRANIQIDMQRRHGFRDIWVSKGDVEIGNNVWIGDNVVILSGVKVGDGAVIGAGSLVTHNIPPFGVAAGNPAHIIKMRFSPNIIEQLVKMKWWTWSEEKIARNRVFFDLDLTENPDLDLATIIVS